MPTLLWNSAILAVTLIAALPGASAKELPPFPLTLPSGCHSEMRRVAAYSTSPKYSEYDALGNLESYDVLCVGDNITIDQPLRSSGGIILILTGTLNVNAPIDTRPFFRAATTEPYLGPESAPPYHTNPAINADLAYLKKYDVKVNQALPYDARHAELYKDYYTRCADCIRSADEVWMPELPSGLTPPFINWWVMRGPRNPPLDFPRAGLPPSFESYDKVALRSGDLIIIADKILFPAEALKHVAAPDPLDCSASQKFTPPLIQVGGARGGRGGLGQPNYCMGDPINRGGPSRWSCLGEPGGLNAPGGPGGDAGHVYIYKIGTSAPFDHNSIRERIDVAGGAPGSRTKIRVPQYLAGNNVCSISKMKESWLASAEGREGVVEFSEISVGEAWEKAFVTAQTFDSMFTPVLSELANRAKVDDRIVSLSFTDHLQATTRVMAGEAQARFAKTMYEFVDSARRGRSPLAPRAISLPLLVSQVPISLPELLRASLTEYVLLSKPELQESIFAYLAHYGGLEQTLRDRPQLELDLKQIREALRTQVQIQSEIELGLRELSQIVLSIDLRAEMERQKAEISAIESSIALALADFAARQNAADSEWAALGNEYLKGIMAFGAALTGAYPIAAGVALSPSEKVKRKRDLEAKVESSAADLGKTLIRISQMRSPEPPTLHELQKALYEARLRFQAFEVDAAARREQARQQSLRSLTRALSFRRDNNNALRNRIQIFPELLKHVWLNFVRDPSRRYDILLSNLSALEEFSRGNLVPAEIQLSEGSGTIPCPQAAGELSHVAGDRVRDQGWAVVGPCLIVGAALFRRVFSGRIEGEHPLRGLEFPLFIAAPFAQEVKSSRIDGFAQTEIRCHTAAGRDGSSC